LPTPGVSDEVAFDPQPRPQDGQLHRTLEPSDEPLEIISEPRPAFTDEALAERIQGEVLLRVIFRSSGRVDVIGIVRGLGYGLDETAVIAARRIRFKPAQKEGRPVDVGTVIRVVFRLTER
jgi:TonB family protein